MMFKGLFRGLFGIGFFKNVFGENMFLAELVCFVGIFLLPFIFYGVMVIIRRFSQGLSEREKNNKKSTNPFTD